MSDFFAPPKIVTAAKQYQCSYCAEPINKDDQHVSQSGVEEGQWFSHRFHLECIAEVWSDDDREFIPYNNERPKKLEQQA